ncbi:MAG: S8 family serine peptidase [Thermodesulfobacteriota bacterium]
MIRRLSPVLALTFLLALAAPAAAFTPNDPLNPLQWGFGAVGMGDAWDYNLGGRSDVKVAVVDTGVAYDIADFGNTRFDLANAFDYVNNDANPYDDAGHGTHVAATIAQSTNNGLGASGIAFNTTILPIKALDSQGRGYSSWVSQGIRRAVDAGSDIINLSLGFVSYSSELQSACEYARNRGVLVVAAAGNSYPYLRYPDYPAWFSSTLAVGAIDPGFESSYYSQYAWDISGGGVVAPGDDIIQQTQFGADERTGTSMATAFVSGIAALAIAEAYDNNKGIPAKGDSSRFAWLKSLLTSTTLDLGAAGPDLLYGYGLVRAENVMRALQ